MESLPKSFLIDRNQIRQSIAQSKQFDIYHTDSGIKIDFWFSKDTEFEKNKFLRKKTITVNRQKVDLISPEDLILTKLVWCRKIRSERHINDCCGIIKIQGDKLDRSYLLKWSDKLGIRELLKEIY